MLAISYFILLPQHLFVTCLFEKVYWEGKRLAENIYSQNCWDAQLVSMKCKSTSSTLKGCLLIYIFNHFLFFLKGRHIFLHAARIKLAQRASCFALRSDRLHCRSESVDHGWHGQDLGYKNLVLGEIPVWTYDRPSFWKYSGKRFGHLWAVYGPRLIENYSNFAQYSAFTQDELGIWSVFKVSNGSSLTMKALLWSEQNRLKLWQTRSL